MADTRALLVVALLAGCVAPAASLPFSSSAPSFTFAPARAVTHDCPYQCPEPSIASDAAGTILVANGAEFGNGTIARSRDGGATWDAATLPPMPSGVRGFDDALLQPAPDGRIFYSALTYDSPRLLGLAVTSTSDGGGSWATPAHLVLPGDPSSPSSQPIEPDRQWLAFAPDGAIYLSYNQVPTGTWVARSDDAGATWTRFVLAVTSADRTANLGLSGKLVVDHAGIVWLPVMDVARGGLRMARSADRGATWSSQIVWSRLPTPSNALGIQGVMPIAVVSPDGSIHVATAEGAGEAPSMVISSSDGGRSWSKAVVWGRGSQTAPWIDARGTEILLMWQGDGLMHLARGDATGPVEDVVLGRVVGGIRGQANTDFAQFSLMRDGRALAAFSGTAEHEAMVTVEAMR